MFIVLCIVHMLLYGVNIFVLDETAVLDLQSLGFLHI